MAWSETAQGPRYSEPRVESESRPLAALLAAVQGEVLEAMGIGVLACDSAYRVLVASARARAILSRFPSTTATDQLPEPIVAALREDEHGPMKVLATGQTLVVWTRPTGVGGASRVVWLGVERGTGDLDAMLRRRWHLTRRQLDLIHQLRQGHRNQEIAAQLGLTCSTVKSYLSHLFDALGVRSRGEAIALIERVCRGE